jgi:DNA-binding LacI/PurR family transcriptional regulator
VQAVTIADVARAAGVSKGLVSLALNDRPGVAAATRERVLEAAAKLGWTPSQYARGLSLRTTFSLGLVMRRDPTVLGADPFFPSFIAGVQSVLSLDGWSLLISVVPDEAAELRAYRSLAHSRVDGFFLTDLRTVDPRPGLMSELGTAAVLIGPAIEDSSLPSVNLDDRPGVEATIEHLVALGHQRIGYVTGDLTLVHGRGRLEAVQRALARAQLTRELIKPGDFSAASGAAATTALLADPDPPTAIAYASDPMAIAGLAVLQAAGVTVPDEISIVGYNGVELGGYLHPPLTTVRTDPYAWGAESARVLRAHLDPDRPVTRTADRHELPAAELVIRGSTAARPSVNEPSRGRGR